MRRDRHWAKGLWTLGGFIGSAAAGHRAGDKLTHEVERGYGQTTEVGAYANQRLNLAKLGRPMEEMPWFRTGPGKTGRPGLSGGPAKRSHGGIVNPSCNRKGETGNPPPDSRRARALSQLKSHSPRGGAGKKRGAKMRADEQEPDTRPTVAGEEANDDEAPIHQAHRW